MNKYGLTDSDNEFEKRLLKEARSIAKRHVLPKFVLQELLSFFNDLHSFFLRDNTRKWTR